MSGRPLTYEVRIPGFSVAVAFAAQNEHLKHCESDTFPAELPPRLLRYSDHIPEALITNYP